MATPLLHASVIEPGELLDGKYRFERELGRGAMGTVWTAVHESLGQYVAIKVISPEHAGSLELRTRFEREARAAAKLRSRFVVSVFDHGTTSTGLPYIVMEYLEGETLEDRVLRLGRLPLDEACRVTRHVARGLAAAHARGIVHRDLKPGNIFIVRSEHDDQDDWTAKILDFGVAKMDDFSERNTTRTGTVIGTPLYMSPEQVRGSSTVDARADLYSLGMVFFNMLTGGFAFDGQSFGDLLISICTEDLPVLSSRAGSVSPALDAWFAKACAKDPNLRFQSAEELIRALDLASSGADGLRSVSDSTADLPAAELAATFASPNETARGGTARNLIDSDGGAAVTVVPKQKKQRLALYVALALGALGSAAAFALISGMGGGPSPTEGPPRAASPVSPATSQEAPTKPREPAVSPPASNPSPSEAAEAKVQQEPEPDEADAAMREEYLKVGQEKAGIKNPNAKRPKPAKRPRPTTAEQARPSTAPTSASGDDVGF